MNFRQVHLDFHTSGEIEGIGSQFSREQFQAALKAGHVGSITLFSKCHHGYAYHPSKANTTHPHLDFDLLGAQIEAAHEIGVKTPIYISAGLDEKMAREHPDWLFRNPDESTEWVHDFHTPGYHRFCMNSPYLDYLLDQIKEVLENYDGDGIFLDIVGAFPCYCQHCVKKMRERGWDPYDPENAYKLGVETYLNYARRVRETVDSVKPGHPVFHNAGHLQAGRRDFAHTNTHLELESLPTGGWGYDHFPLSAAYARTLGMEFLGMTGKFHLSWGEFGGFKHPNALRYEVALSAANGAKCSIGDQLHPNGKMEMATYKLIGEAYKEIEEKEPWIDHVESVADIALLSQEALFSYMNPGKEPLGKNAWKGSTGASRILLEGKYLFDMVDTEADFSKYKLIIMTDDSVIDRALADRLRAFVDNGGKILATGTSGLIAGENRFAFDLGAKYVGTCGYQPSYLHPMFEMDDLFDAPYVIKQSCEEIEATGEVIGERQNPYFNRTTFHFSSHKHTPNDPTKSYPAITVGEDGAYIAYRLFSEYAEDGPLIDKRVVQHVIDLLLAEDKTLTTSLPAQGVVTLMDQTEERRLINHLLYASPVKRGRNVEVIEDILPIYQTEVSLKIDVTPKRVYLAPQMQDIDFDYTDGLLTYTVPKLECHQMVV
ncbi:MAG: beta-galactosidase trimerization domain-containing protein, partial [Ruminococcus sp.]|nr:beta-galactosidase trimerization domain-containing protein [Candidatus Apopatosoma intestinale]